MHGSIDKIGNRIFLLTPTSTGDVPESRDSPGRHFGFVITPDGRYILRPKTGTRLTLRKHVFHFNSAPDNSADLLALLDEVPSSRPDS
jgi:hypothetical protein